jgi:hypothetical protein
MTGTTSRSQQQAWQMTLLLQQWLFHARPDDRHNVTIAAAGVVDDAAPTAMAVSCETDDRHNVTIAAAGVADDAASIATAASCETDDRHNVTIAAGRRGR